MFIILQIVFATRAVCKIGEYINNSRHLARKYARIFVRGHYLFQKANSFPRAKLEENCELRGTDNVQGQISEHIFVPNGDYCLYYPSNLFRNARSFENWEIFSDIPQFKLGNIRSRDAFRPVARKQKYLMDYNYRHFTPFSGKPLIPWKRTWKGWVFFPIPTIPRFHTLPLLPDFRHQRVSLLLTFR